MGGAWEGGCGRVGEEPLPVPADHEQGVLLLNLLHGLLNERGRDLGSGLAENLAVGAVARMLGRAGAEPLFPELPGRRRWSISSVVGEEEFFSSSRLFLSAR